jgi:hypothetical protein
LLPFSGFEHLANCERPWARLHLKQTWAEDRLTVEGGHLHERADKPSGNSGRDLRIVHGGGISGQSGAVVLGLAGALVKTNADYEPKLRAQDLLTRDARKVERKKYGQSGARKRLQFSKR